MLVSSSLTLGSHIGTSGRLERKGHTELMQAGQCEASMAAHADTHWEPPRLHLPPDQRDSINIIKM